MRGQRLRGSLLLLFISLLAVAGSATELLDARLGAGAALGLENAGGTVRLEQPRLDAIGPRVLFLPEPGALWGLGAASVGLLGLRRLRRRRVAPTSKSKLNPRSLGFVALIVLVAAAVPVPAEVPQDTTFTGRLVDDLGVPLAGPVDLDLRIFDAEIGGNQLYREEQLAVALDPTGGFSVQLGLGTPLSGSFDATLFADVNRWLEVVVDGEVLAPRQIVASVPWALVAEQASEVVPPSRFEDCGDGTVADHQTGLNWETKTGIVGGGGNTLDPHDVGNLYSWGSSTPVGTVFTEFLPALNDPFGEAATANDPTTCFAGHCDWRLPDTVELQTLLDCANAPCIDPLFGPTVSGFYWSASTVAGNVIQAWVAHFGTGQATNATKPLTFSARAVRAGSCR